VHGQSEAAEAEAFRSANDRIAESIRRAAVGELVVFVCECADGSCYASNALTLDEFDRRRALGEPIIGPTCRQFGGPGT
jgi:hypothetical protein